MQHAIFQCSLLLLYVVPNARFSVASSRSYINDYCWRDFQGIVPDDALVAGLDVQGNPIYIGQALYENNLIPGKVYSQDPKIYFEWYLKEIKQTKNIKIFCTSQPQRFEWLQTTKDTLMSISNTIIIRGGYEKDVTSYIGRAFLAGETIVGKVICRDQECLGLYVTSNGFGKELHKFEVLTFNANTPNLCCNYS